MNKKSAIYVRVSTNHQIDKDSLPLQRKDLINYSKFILGIDDFEIFEDAGYSAKNTDRPGFKKMMNRIKNSEFSHLLVWKIDRISRNLMDFCTMYDELKKYNCTFISKNEQFDTSSAMGEAMLKIILVFAELERKLTAERVKAVMLDRASKGLWNGAPIPLGYEWSKELKFPIINKDEAETIKLIYNQYLTLQSTSAIRNLLNNSNIKTKRDGSWTTKTISDIIRNPFYKGTYRYNYRETARGKKKSENEWVLLEDNHEAIISKDLWQSCNDIMDLNAQRNNAKFRSNAKTHIFSSLIKCGECGNILHSKQDKAHLDGFRPSLYVCKGRYNHLGCSQKTISEKIVGEFVFNFISNMIRASILKIPLSLEKLEKYLLTGDYFKDIIAIEGIEEVYNSIYYYSSNSYFPKEKIRNDNIIDFNFESLKKELEKYKKALIKLEDLYLYDDSDLSTKDYLIKKNKIKDKINSINKKLDVSSSKITPSTYNINFLLYASTLELSNALNTGNIEIKEFILNIGREILKDFIGSLIDHIVVENRKVYSIQFKNNLIIKFIYKA